MIQRVRLSVLLLTITAALIPLSVQGAEPLKDEGWIVVKDDTGTNVNTRQMTLHPKAEARPAMKYLFIPESFDMKPGNAALYYLKAMGFFEQDSSRDKIREIYTEAAERAREEDISYGDLPPHSWQMTPPQDLPVEEVKEFLRYVSFQPMFLEEARIRNQFMLDRNIREHDDPIAYLLPEVQAIRELARMQTIRCKLAIAEGRIEDAIRITGQQFAIARHMGQDEFLVSNLVGLACAGIGWDDLLYLVQHPDTPNLYWAIASLPRPLVDISHAMSLERQFLYLQVKVLLEVDETPRPVGYWQDFLDRLIPEFGYMTHEFGLPEDPEAKRALMVAFIAGAYPGAKRYLVEECGLPSDQVEAYPIAQVVFLAIVRYYEDARDDYFKWAQLPYWQAEEGMKKANHSANARQKAQRVGWSAAPTEILLPAVLAARTAVARIQQQLALAQTVEAIRMYGAAHKGKLPKSLDDLSVPAPLDPITGKPFDYQYREDSVVLSGHKVPGRRYRLVLTFAETAK